MEHNCHCDTLPPRVGSKIKINVWAGLEGGLHLKDVNFRVCIFNIRNRVWFDKSELIEVDEDNYIARVDTKEIGSGTYMCRLEVDTPDADFEDGVRPEHIEFPTGIIVK